MVGSARLAIAPSRTTSTIAVRMAAMATYRRGVGRPSSSPGAMARGRGGSDERGGASAEFRFLGNRDIGDRMKLPWGEDEGPGRSAEGALAAAYPCSERTARYRESRARRC